MHACVRLFAAGLLAAAVIAPAAAQTPVQPPAPPALPDAISALVGAWELSNADHDKICIVTFKGDTTPGGYKLDFDKVACLANFPLLKDVTLWALGGPNNDAVRLADPKGKIAYEFTEVESGMYESLKAGQPLTFLQNAAVAAAANAHRTADQMTGDWDIMRGDGPPICTLTLMKTPAASDLALKIKPGCDAIVTRFAPLAWQMENNEIVLKAARGQSWHFEENDGTWQRVPEGAEPLSMVRQ